MSDLCPGPSLVLSQDVRSVPFCPQLMHALPVSLSGLCTHFPLSCLLLLTPFLLSHRGHNDTMGKNCPASLHKY